MSGTSEAWPASAVARLEAKGFTITRDVTFQDQALTAVAHRSRFEITKFGNCETFFVFGDLDTCDADAVSRFSSLAFQYAKANKSCGLPCGLFEAIYSFGVCAVDSLDQATADHVRNTVPPKHWAAAEVPVVYDRSQRDLCYFEKTPLWGAAYYAGFRKQIKTFLA